MATVEQFWVPLAVMLVGTVIITVVPATCRRIQRRKRERRVLRFLRDNTEDRAGKQYIPIAEVARNTKMDVDQVTAVVDASPSIYRNTRDQNLIGIYETERSIYDERGLITM